MAKSFNSQKPQSAPLDPTLAHLRIPPHSIEAEQSVLGGLLLDNAAFDKNLLNDLTNARESSSGVSVDEESANLITYQQAYEAAARVVSTIQELFSITMNMGTAAAA